MPEYKTIGKINYCRIRCYFDKELKCLGISSNYFMNIRSYRGDYQASEDFYLTEDKNPTGMTLEQIKKIDYDQARKAAFMTRMKPSTGN